MAFTRKSTAKIYEVHAHAPKTTCLDIGETGRVLVTGGQDRYIKLWTFENEENIMSLKGHHAAVDLVKFAYNDDYVYSADVNGIIKKWDLNSGQDTTTLYGHMKTVRAMHFHPFGDYVVSGSHDTTLRLWDIRVDNCIKRYRGHISSVNSVKFSPDGTWIASAGNEGALIIWDIRMSNKAIVEFSENPSAILCIQYHPFEFLLAAGRVDGTVHFYDLEKKALISSRENSTPRLRQGVNCVAFNEDGNCLFAGTADSVAVIGWEPDKEYDRVEGTWKTLGDMAVLNRRLLCGAFENNTVSVHAIGIDQLMPFYNPSNVPFSHNQGSRKSFSNRTGKLRLSIGNSNKLSVNTTEEENEHSLISGDGQSSPNLSIEMIDDDPMETVKMNYPLVKSGTFDKKTKNNSDSFQIDKYMKTHTNGKTDNYRSLINDYSSDLDYYPVRSSPLLNNVVEPEREDFPVNNAQQPDYAPKLNTMTITKTVIRQKVDIRRGTSNANPPTNYSQSNRTQSLHGGVLNNKKIMSSTSTTDLNKIEDNQTVMLRRPVSRGGSPIRVNNPSNNNNVTKLKKSESITQFSRDRDRDYTKNKNIPVHFVTKPQPVARSKTNIDLRAAAIGSSHTPPSRIPNYVSDVTNEDHEIQLLATCHESVYQALRNRSTSLQIIRSMKSTDSHSIIKNAVQINDHSVLVDLIGAITEKSIPLNLDSCVTLLPEIYELLKSEYNFHAIRACDILRTILSTFLPTIRANIDPYGPARSLGVDITREERQHKCMTCREWLLRIRCLPENKELGSTFTQLQNMITDL